MKKALLILVILSSKLWAQAPQQINYQGLARNAAGVPISSLSTIGVIFTISDGSNGIVHLETQASVPISTLGLFSTKIGLSPAISNTINWQNGPYTLSVSIDAGAGFNFVGSQQLVSVPFALYAKSAGNAAPSGTSTGQTMYWEQPNGWKIDSHLYNDGSHVSIGAPLNTTTNKLLVVTAAGVDSAAISGRHYNSQKSQAGVTGLATGNFPLAGSNFEPLYGGLFAGINTNSGAAAGVVGNGKSLFGDGFGVVAIGSSGSNVLNVGRSIALYAKASGAYYPNKYAAVFDSGRVVINDTLQLNINGSNGYVLTRWFNGKAIWAPPAGANSTTISSGNSNITVFGVTPNYTISSTPSLGLVGNFLSISNGNTVTLPGPTANTTLTGIGSTSISGTFPSFTITTPTVSAGWSLLGNAGTNTLTNFIGTTDANDLSFRVNNIRAGRIESVAENVFFGYLAGPNTPNASANTGIGSQALNANTSGLGNTAVGYIALPFNTTGDYNTAIGGASQLGNTTGGRNVSVGYQSLRNNTNGGVNVAIGNDVLGSNTTGNSNTGVGAEALYYNATGNFNTAIGYQSLLSNTTSSLTANGYQSLYSNTTGGENTATGFKSMFANTVGDRNSAFGALALDANTAGSRNSSFGYLSLSANTIGNQNSAFGSSALRDNTNGINNSAFGIQALMSNNTGSANSGFGGEALTSYIGNNSTAMGWHALFSSTSGAANTALGAETGLNNTTGSGNVFLGYRAGFNEIGSNKLYIANSAANPPLIYGDFSTGLIGLGTIAPTAKLDVNGTVMISGPNSNELNRGQTGNANLVPIAYGNAVSSGTLNVSSTTSNVTLTSHVGGSGVYNYTIVGESFLLTDYVVTATLLSGPGEISFDSVSGQLIIYTYNSSGVATDKAFTFVVYKK